MDKKLIRVKWGSVLQGVFLIILVQRVISRVPDFQKEPAKMLSPPPPKEGGCTCT